MVCNRCKVEKHEDEFIYGKLKCRECYKKCREYYQSHREQEIARAQKSNLKKDRVIENKNKRARCRKNPAAYMLWNIKSRAKARGIPFDLSHEDILIPKTCPVLGLELKMSEGCPSANSPSIDRINPKFGYVKGNIQIISYRANTIKSDATLEELKLVVKHMESQEPIILLEDQKDFIKISRYLNKNKKTLEQ